VTREPVRLALVMDRTTQQFARSAADRIHDAGCDRSVSWDFDLLGDTTRKRPGSASPGRS
jgi:hypothetical protein